jgi:hypothetical protein
MKKALILGAMAFVAINIMSVQQANAQVDKMREQVIQGSFEPGKQNQLVSPGAKDTTAQNTIAPVNKQREQVLQATKDKGMPNEPTKLDSKIGLKHGMAIEEQPLEKTKHAKHAKHIGKDKKQDKWQAERQAMKQAKKDALRELKTSKASIQPNTAPVEEVKTADPVEPSPKPKTHLSKQEIETDKE